MTIPVDCRPVGKRYLGDLSTMQVHDLRNQKTACHIDETIRAGNAVVFASDGLPQTRVEGYRACTYCIGGRHR